MQPPSKENRHLLGLGLDNQDGHKRITQAERFTVVGGSDETHGRMTETLVKTYETLDRRGKSIETVEKSELRDIIKENTPVVISERQSECDPVFRAKAEAEGAPIYFARDLIASGRLYLELDLKGAYQENNLRGVLCAVDLLEAQGWKIKTHCEAALSKVCTLTGLRGRWEQIREKPLTICDTGHNITGVQAVVEQLKKQSYRQLHIVWGMVNDKDIREVLRILPPSAFYYFTQASIPRAMDATELQREALKFGLAGKAFPTVKDAVKQAESLILNDDLLFIGGSTFVVADYLASLESKD